MKLGMGFLIAPILFILMYSVLNKKNVKTLSGYFVYVIVFILCIIGCK